MQGLGGQGKDPAGLPTGMGGHSKAVSRALRDQTANKRPLAAVLRTHG